MDNRILNINGRTIEQLKLAIQVACLDEYGKYQKIRGWRYSQKKGLILLWYLSEKDTKFPVEMNHTTIADVIWQWLETEDAKKVECEGWDADADHDGDNEKGWRLYVEDWGHVDSSWGVSFAVKPAYLWYGK
jgi:hypothetical protein